ncbi:unnamed protein product [Linum trigynum]|uniref:AP2/ERF domain-containing protein n=1 Tax=Linum trigynum TaxID=586398 RepID=A0AAV2DHE0_9ROSI
MTSPPPSSSSDGGRGSRSPPCTGGRPSRPPPKRKAGRKKFQETRHPIYKGVRRRNDKWVCEIRHPQNTKSRIWLGTFTCPETAGRAHDVAALALCRAADSAGTRLMLKLNFPESAHSLPRAASDSVKDIQRAVVQLATVETGGGAVSGDGVGDVEGGDWGAVVGKVEPMVFVDEEELFNMPALLNGMAEGMIVTPPGMKRGFCWDDDVDGGGDDQGMDFTLWSDY